jgi:uncharacterized RDD family membrane protein YckC
VPPGGWQQPVAQTHAWAGAPLSGWWRRVGAQVLDGLILTLPALVFAGVVAAAFAVSNGLGIAAVVLAVIAYIAIFIVYAPLLMKREGERNGQSWGKQALDIRVARDTGEQVEFGWALLRQFVVIYLLFNVVGGLFASIPTLINYLWPLWDDSNRALHDMIVKSHVLKT